MATGRPSHDRPADKLHVVYLVRLVEGGEQGFLEAYERVRRSVVDVPGHLAERMGRSLDGSRQWVISSDWETPEHFLAWVQGEEHRALVARMHAWIEHSESLRFRVVRETAGARG